MQTLSPTDRTTLLNYFTSRYSTEEVETLVFELGINSELLKKSDLTVFARELILYCERNDKVGCLLQAAIKEKPDPAPQAIYQRCPSCTPGVKLEVIIRDAGMKDLNKALLDFLQTYGLKPGEVSVVGATSGSLRMLISVPPYIADRILSNPVTELANGRYHVESVELYTRLSPEEQTVWRTSARRTPAVRILVGAGGGIVVKVSNGGSAAGGLVMGIVLVVLALTAAGGVAYMLAPRLNIQNNCGYAIPLSTPVPIIGGNISIDNQAYIVPPGDYTVSEKPSNSGGTVLRVAGPLGLDTGDFTVNERFTISKDGTAVPLSRPISIGPSSKIDLVFCNR